MNPVAVYDFTIPAREEYTVDVVKGELTNLCKKWCFQLERGEITGYLHYQGRMSLKVKTRLDTLSKKFFSGDCHLSPTCSQNQGNDFYVTKDETRVDGPWRDDDEVIYIPRQIRDIKEFFPWQIKMYNISREWDPRRIHVVYDPDGCTGKTIFTTWMCCNKWASKIPYMNEFKDIMRMAMDMPKRGCYLIDLPRAIKKEKLYGFYSAIEELKNGHAWDDRYTYKEEWFDCPQIIVFTNKLPDTELLSRDRWVIWSIRSRDLILYNSLEVLPSVAEVAAFHCNNKLNVPEQPEQSCATSL